MPTFSLSGRSSATDPLTCIFDFRTQGGFGATVYEIGIAVAGSSSGQMYGLGFPSVRAASVGQITIQAPYCNHDPASPASHCILGLTFSSFVPVPPKTFLRQFRPNTTSGIGSGVVWTFERGLVMPINSSLCMWNLGLGSAFDYWLEWNE